MNQSSMLQTVLPKKNMSESDLIKTEFVFIASHQLRTPLTSIKLYLELIFQDTHAGTDPTIHQYLKNIYTSTNRMVNLVDDLLSISRMESGELRVEPVLVEFIPFFESVMEEVRPIANDRGCKILFSMKNVNDVIEFDPKLLHIVLHNLLLNGIKYTNKKSSIVRVQAKVIKKKNHPYLHIEITDNGIGIPKAAQKHIFKRFFRGENALKIQTDGSGLGLYISKMIMEFMKGSISFTSKVHQGTTFTVELPVSSSKK